MPDPLVLEIAVEAKAAEDAERLKPVVERLCAGDPEADVYIDQESGQIVLKGVDELQLDKLIGRILETVPVNVGAPQVAYRETITFAVEIDHTYKRQNGGSGRFARVKLAFSPGRPGSGFRFRNDIAGGAIPDEYILGVESGLLAAKGAGLLAGFEVIDFTATLVDGAFHDVDSSVLAFDIAARMAFKELREKGRPMLLYPMMLVIAAAPARLHAAVERFLKERNGVILGAKDTVEAHVPLVHLFGVRGACRAEFGDEVVLKWTFSHYAPVPTFDDPDPDFSPAIGMRA